MRLRLLKQKLEKERKIALSFAEVMEELLNNYEKKQDFSEKANNYQEKQH